MAKSKRQAARWALQDAKNRFSEVVQAAVDGEPQIVTRRGVETAVVISRAEWERVIAARDPDGPSLATYLLEIPTTDAPTEFEHLQLGSREVAI